MEKNENEIEVTYKFYLPTHASELEIFHTSADMHIALSNIDEECRKIIKYKENPSKELVEFANIIRDLTSDFIN